ncbi:MAG TPA: radical SAM protein, partial [Rhodothermales bacterium]
PVGVITKNHLITRDIDVLAEMARLNLVSTTISITSLRPELIGVMEPRTSRPAARLEAVRKLAEAGIPVGVNVAPVIPGLTDEEIPAILKAAAEAGATRANYIVVRLPGPVQPLFLEWLERTFPERKQKVVNRLTELRGGRLNDPRFKSRMRGEGEWADTISKLFKTACRRYGLNQKERTPLSTEHFRVPARRREDGQLGLFG